MIRDGNYGQQPTVRGSGDGRGRGMVVDRIRRRKWFHQRVLEGATGMSIYGYSFSTILPFCMGATGHIALSRHVT